MISPRDLCRPAACRINRPDTVLRPAIGRTPAQRRKSHRVARGAALLLAVSLSGCCLWPTFHHRDQSTAAAPTGLRFTRIELRRLGCISGDCPAYTVVINGDGTVDYHGYAAVAVRGSRHGRADPKALRQLRQQLASPDVFWLNHRYAPGHDNCGAWSMNDAAVSLQIDAPTLHEHIDHYLGCHNAPRLLVDIETAVDRAAAVTRWTAAH